MTEATTPLSEYEAAKNAALDARLRLETRLDEIEKERRDIRTLLGRTRKPRAAATKPARKSRKPAAEAAATA